MLLATDREIEQRRSVAAGSLAPLADSLAADLDRLLPDEDVFIPREKAKMTRRGGRCEQDGTFLEFDPGSPRRHRCPTCGVFHDAEEHYRWWIMGYQLWLAERAVHAAALWRLRDTPRHLSLAESILEKLSDAYPGWPDEDNVLGPTRVFFSTYLESIWLLQLSLALSILESGGSSRIAGRVRDAIIAPSSELIASYDEGLSNRQVWNASALGAAGVLLGRRHLNDLAAQSLGHLLRDGMLDDGTWYEGENYHLFAHRGMWHLVRLADEIGADISRDARRKFELGFAAPLRTALPDFTFPARRDSQYRASLRQWRIAESLELGRAGVADPTELTAGLAALYAGGSHGDSCRWRSTAEAERNVPPVRLTRADLGWKSLLFALPEEPSSSTMTSVSALMDGQGFAVVRRDEGRTYVALDYGHRGGSHGHPDRLNLWLVVGDDRVFEDVGTGSYVEKALHWYRSTLAHNAPLIDGRSQEPVSGTLRAFDERGPWTWVDAEATIANDVVVRRTLVVGQDHLVDLLEWTASRYVTVDLPMHVDADVEGAAWRAGILSGQNGLEDGFDFLSEAEWTSGRGTPVQIETGVVRGSVSVNVDHEWWRATAPGPPREHRRRFLLLRARGTSGRLTSTWSWKGHVSMSARADQVIDVQVGHSRYAHRATGPTWQVTHNAAEIVLDGRRSKPLAPSPRRSVERPPMVISASSQRSPGARFELARENYRRTEASWEEAGSPTALIEVGANATALLIDVHVPNTNPNFVSARDENPLDNEHPDVNSDGVQVHLSAPGINERELHASWLLVPEQAIGVVRKTVRGDAVPLEASWSRSARGWGMSIRIPRAALGTPDSTIGLDVIVNEMPRGRERRRGQLVLSGRGSGWAYLRGDRQDRQSLIPMVVRDE